MDDENQNENFCNGSLNTLISWQKHLKVRQMCQKFVMNNKKLTVFMNVLSNLIDLGLKKETHDTSTIRCFQTYAQDIPTGNEQGRYIALDLGGSNFRVLNIELDVGRQFRMDQETFSCSKQLMAGSGEELFDYIAQCLKDFLTKRKLESEINLPLGFTFSFPIYQSRLDSAILTNWTKGFTCDGVVGNDVVKLLNRSIAKHSGLNIKVCVILNDTVGTLMSCAWKDPNTKIGLIIGTGTNCCYLEKIDRIEMFDGDSSKEEMVINLEWGAFGDKGELDDIITKYDKTVNRNSVNPNQQTFEKMVSGMYLGELFRLLLLDMAKNNLIFDGHVPEILLVPQSITTNVISTVESDVPETYTLSRQCLQKLGIENVTESDLLNIRYAAHCISRRSAELVAAGLAVLLERMNEENITIGVDGSVYRLHPYYHQILVNKVNELVKGKSIKIMLSEDGSGRGAAVLAAALNQVHCIYFVVILNLEL
ncbi:hexokinase type 2-like [Daktulosphaira vitifoliae]|uniref:hexokinase type 2-like n=1 Tax=Daktulosphaira vitifoliae TaxID=58002 RepID=UPI0021AA950E|nr:hexokinase type 2-like [Daktulosphaira vitifoliae]